MTFVSKKTVNRIEEINREGVLSLEELDTLLLDDQCFDTTLKLLSRRIDPAVAILPSSWGSKGTRGASIDKDTEEPLEIEPGGKTEPVIDPGQGRRILQEPLSRFDEYALAKRLEFHRSRLHHFLGNFHRTDNTPLYEPGRGGSPARISLTWIVGVLGTNPRVMPIDKLTARSLWNNYNNCRSGWVEKNLPKVTVMVRSYRSYGISTDDLSQEGFAALIRAVEKYDWRKKVRFWTYAVFWVRQAVERYICFNKVTIRIPNYLQQKVRRLKRKGRFRHDMDEDMVREMSSEFGMDRIVAKQIVDLYKGQVSLDGMEPNARDYLLRLHARERELDDYDQAEEYVLMKRRLRRAIKKLTERERLVLTHRYGLGDEEIRTLEHIGVCLNLSRERIRQIEKRAILKLRRNSNLMSV